MEGGGGYDIGVGLSGSSSATSSINSPMSQQGGGGSKYVYGGGSPINTKRLLVLGGLVAGAVLLGVLVWIILRK